MIQADKLRNFESSFLANFIGDFNHNKRRWEENMKLLNKDFNSVERDNLWRAKSTLNEFNF